MFIEEMYLELTLFRTERKSFLLSSEKNNRDGQTSYKHFAAMRLFS